MTEGSDQDGVAEKRTSDRLEGHGLTLLADPASRYEPFPLTDVQKAYWLGRSSDFELGNVGCHVYFEFDSSDVDRARMQAAWQKLIDRHDMLRAVVNPDGTQQVLPHTPHYEIKHLNLRGSDDAEAQSRLQAIRQRMSHQTFRPDRWPLFELRTTERGTQTLLHFSLDLLFVDLWSMQLLFDEWAQLSLEQDPYLPPLEISFRDYVLASAELRASESYRRAEQYWLERIETLPPAPRLPLTKSPASVTQPEFVRREAVLDRELWRRLKGRSARALLTPSGMLLTAFSRILATWSQNQHFTLNTTLFQRTLLHPQVYGLIGDFTSTLLFEVRHDPAASFKTLAKQIATQFRTDLEHRQYSGVQLLREIAKQGDPERPPSSPVVFTSALAQSMPGWQSADGVGRLTFGITQTPQVYLDHQVYERAGNLHCTWDAVQELFPPGLLDEMFAAYIAYLRRLADDEAAWSETCTDLLPPRRMPASAAANDATVPVPTGLLHGPFLDQVRKRPEHPALVTWNRSLSYADLHRQAWLLTRQLRRLRASPNRLVAIVMEKGWEQVVAALAILQAGAAYLPLDPDLPRERRWLLLQRGEVEIVLTQPCFVQQLEWPSGVNCVAVDWQDAGPDDDDNDQFRTPEPQGTDLAYVMFTSGSTGEPKGVMVEHRSALNTILDINHRFRVGPDDRIFALSSLSFDLSVYDIFGTLAVGATVVLPHPTSLREPGEWAHLLLQERVTIWNSVPALFEMLVEHADSRSRLLGHSLRLALLSGDWIPVKLPDRARALLPGLQLISLGGATEASIWSIFYPIDVVGDDWKSIPYGRSLGNQQMHVLNDAMQACPTWVPGQIYISGAGLARGYWRDEARTDAQFLRHPQTGEWLYRTGDLGCYLPTGDIEFLGREDDQVKVQGYRIELGEIEAVLDRHPQVKASVVTAVGERSGSKYLAAYVVADGISVEALTEYLRQKLPSYMVPNVWQTLDRLPLTTNGKVNRKALPGAALLPTDATANALGDDAETLARVVTLIGNELGHPSLDPNQNLLNIGATSIDLVRIVGRLEAEFGIRPSFQEFFREPTAAALARVVQRRRNAASGVTSGTASSSMAQRRALELIVDPQAREAFRRENRGIRTFAPEWGRLPLDDGPESLHNKFRRRRSIRRFLSEPVSIDAIGGWLAELRRMTIDGSDKYGYGSAGGCYPVQTYLYAKPDGITGCPAGTFYYHPMEHQLIPLSLGTELDPAIHEPFVNRSIFEHARFSLFFVTQPRAIEPMYGDLAFRFSVLEAGAMAHALETSAWRFGLGVCPIGWLDFAAIRGLLDLQDGQELLHAHVGGLAEPFADAADWQEGVI